MAVLLKHININVYHPCFPKHKLKVFFFPLKYKNTFGNLMIVVKQ